MRSYVTGFILSILLTLSAYFLVVSHGESGHTFFDHNFLIFSILALAVIQLVVQLVFFLHLGRKSSGWNLAALISTASVILLIVVASIWIMNNLNYNMTPHQMSEFLIEKEGIHK